MDTDMAGGLNAMFLYLYGIRLKSLAYGEGQENQG
jgi:hypothetical protein